MQTGCFLMFFKHLASWALLRHQIKMSCLWKNTFFKTCLEILAVCFILLCLAWMHLLSTTPNKHVWLAIIKCWSANRNYTGLKNYLLTCQLVVWENCEFFHILSTSLHQCTDSNVNYLILSLFKWFVETREYWQEGKNATGTLSIMREVL